MSDPNSSDPANAGGNPTDSDPVNPAEPIEPQDPANPAEPINPGENPVDPEPTDPAEPINPGENNEDPASLEGEEGDSKKVKKRIGKLTAKNYQSEQRIKRLEAELAEKNATTETVEKPTRPDELQFDDPAEFQAAQEKYDEDSFNYRMTERDKKTAVQSSADLIKEQRQERIDSFDKKVTEIGEKIPDFEEVARSEEMLEIYDVAPHLADVIEESESGPEIAYFLGNNPEEAVRLAGLSTVQVAIEVGKLEGKLSNALPKKNISKAAKPVNTLTGKGGEVVGKSVDDMTQKEYEAWRNKKK